MCDFDGYKSPEIVKTRPVIVISPNHLTRPGLVTVIPLSTTTPNPICDYHFELPGSPFPHDKTPVWAKCDLPACVSVERLDRVKVSRGKYEVFYVGSDTIRAVRRRAALSFGLDLTKD
jgi:mRNA interferase MazF